VTIAGAQGRLELNIFKPVNIQNVLQSCRLLADSAIRFAINAAEILILNHQRIAENQAKSFVLVTAFNPRIGYDIAVKIGKFALAENITLEQAAEQLGFVRPEDFYRWVVPAAMTVPGATLRGGGG
jgi:fumarate hydratase class II